MTEESTTHVIFAFPFRYKDVVCFLLGGGVLSRAIWFGVAQFRESAFLQFPTDGGRVTRSER